jgi:hypothetical protein
MGISSWENVKLLAYIFNPNRYTAHVAKLDGAAKLPIFFYCTLFYLLQVAVEYQNFNCQNLCQFFNYIGRLIVK